jgi:hypothetical protein
LINKKEKKTKAVEEIMVMKEFKFESRNDDDNKEIFKLDDSKPLK